MNILFAYGLLASVVIYAFVTSRYVFGASWAFCIIVVETAINIPRDSGWTFFTLSGMVAITVLVIMDGRKYANDSVLIRFNPFHKENVIPKKLKIIICIIFSLALLLRIIVFSRPSEGVDYGRADEEYRQAANEFIDKMVIAHGKGDDFHSVARCNPFTNDVFVCRVVALLESEYKRVDGMRQSISATMKLAAAERGERLRGLAEECIRESSNVVQRINSADIGEMKARKMATDFSVRYIELHKECCKAVERNE